MTVDDKAAEMYASGLSFRAVSNALGIARGAVRRAAVSRGVVIRQGGWKRGKRSAFQCETLTADRARQLLFYDAKTGQFRRLVMRGSCKAGDDTFYKTRQGYLRTGIDRKNFMLHRLAWLITYGDWPAGQIDHINGDRADNRLCNLRVADASQNRQNLKSAQRTNKSGFLGVRSTGGVFQAWIKHRGVDHYLGTWSDPKPAHEAYLAKKRELHEFNTL